MLAYKGFKQNYCNIKLLFPIDWNCSKIEAYHRRWRDAAHRSSIHFFHFFCFYFKDSTGTAPGVHQFKVGMKFEAIDPFNPSHVCVVTVIKVLRFNYFVLGVDSLATYFVCHANSINVFPCGWAKAHGLQLHPPRGGICFCFFLLEN